MVVHFRARYGRVRLSLGAKLTQRVQARCMPGNIARVWVADHEISRDADLDVLTRFEVQTDAGNHYIVHQIDTEDGKPSDWEVQLASDSSPVGQIHATQSLWGSPSEYRFTKDGASFSGGKQLDLWNAVQSLTE